MELDDYRRWAYAALGATVFFSVASVAVFRFTGQIGGDLGVFFLLLAAPVLLGGVLFHLMRGSLRRLPRRRHEELAELLSKGMNLPYVSAMTLAFLFVLRVYVDELLLQLLLVGLWVSVMGLQFLAYRFHSEMSKDLQ